MMLNAVRSNQNPELFIYLFTNTNTKILTVGIQEGIVFMWNMKAEMQYKIANSLIYSAVKVTANNNLIQPCTTIK